MIAWAVLQIEERVDLRRRVMEDEELQRAQALMVLVGVQPSTKEVQAAQASADAAQMLYAEGVVSNFSDSYIRKIRAWLVPADAAPDGARSVRSVRSARAS